MQQRSKSAIPRNNRLQHFINKKPQTTYTLTNKGKEEFIAYIDLLKSLVQEEEDENVKNFRQNSTFVLGI